MDISAPVAIESKSCLCGFMCCLLKAFILAVITIFVVCLPLGDPEEQCIVQTASDINRASLTYACNVYQAVSKTMLFTGNALQRTVQFTTCVMANALYDAKLKFYTMLERVDKEDVCRFICCTDNDCDDSTQTTKEHRGPCKCRGRCCRVRAKV